MDPLKRKIELWFRTAVAAHPTAHPELKRSLLTVPMHERARIFVDNMVHELKTIQASQVYKGKPAFKDKTIRDVIYDFTEMFLGQVELAAKHRHLSDLERMRLASEAQAQRDLDATVDGTPSGIFEEAGLIYNEQVIESGSTVLPHHKN